MPDYPFTGGPVYPIDFTLKSPDVMRTVLIVLIFRRPPCVRPPPPSIKRRRKRASWEPQYLLEILGPLRC
jgi:hypothetical protein